MLWYNVQHIKNGGEYMGNPIGRPRDVLNRKSDVLCVRYYRAIRSTPSKQTIKDIEAWLNRMKWLEKIRWKTSKRTEAITKATKHLVEHSVIVERMVAKRWWDRYVEDVTSEELNKDYHILTPLAKKVLKDSTSVEGFTVLTTDNAFKNSTVLPLISFRNKFKNKTLCIYKDFLVGDTTIQDYYKDAK